MTVEEVAATRLAFSAAVAKMNLPLARSLFMPISRALASAAGAPVDRVDDLNDLNEMSQRLVLGLRAQPFLASEESWRRTHP